MEENNMSEDDGRDNNENNSSNNNPFGYKRLKIDISLLEKAIEESSSSSSNSNHTERTEQETASTSTDSGFPKSRNSKNRNYRTQHGEDSNSANESTEESAEQDQATETENITNMSSFSPDSSASTVINDTDTDSDEDEHPVLKKPAPHHNWFVVPEVFNRQYGYSSKVQSSDLFRMKCYGSLRNVQRLELMYKLEEHDGCVNSLNFHPDGSLLASGSDDLKIVIWDWKVGNCLLKYDSKHRGNVFQSKFLHLSGDLHIASCARDGQVRIVQVSREEGVRDNRKLGSHKGPCHKLAVIPDQPHIILSAGEDALVLSHDLRKPKPEKIVMVTEDDQDISLYSIHGNPLKTQEFCVSGRDEIVRVYDQRKSSGPLHTYHPFKRNQPNEKHGLHVTCAVYNHDGSEILASYNDEDIYLFDVNAPPGNYLHQFQGHRNGATIKGVNFFGPKSEFIVSGSDCGNVYFWERNTEAIVQWMLADDNGVVNCLEPHPSLPYICTSGLDWDVKVWVPSCEQEPAMKDLADTLKSNSKSRMDWAGAVDMNESQMLWMLWRHLRTTNRRQRMMSGFESDINFHFQAASSSSDSSSESEAFSAEDDDDDELEGPSGCTTS